MKTEVEVVGNQLVAGTVILNGVDGSKKFLVKQNQTEFDFIMTTIEETYTSLASILHRLKTDVLVDVTNLNLVELTNVQVDDKKIPLYVFEIDENQEVKNIAKSFQWETPETLRKVLSRGQVTGVPIFQ
ncbi:hypothetical protein PML95_08960 [Vagococcus lutrae]|uniref:Uncharacterized protein n=2 Tax=Vagococcus lutrae TaxID=81947 RepID=A0AAF0BHJ2_9ENTE|nr:MULTISPECIES: hypothetical protein [Vagococcus]MCO7151910.1 hypothetical protein [Vagococcus lutrae]MDO5742218.1 hypothetical protein [Vagococcus sp.]MDT2802322.1 hypothetical protein [Vagococcus lutrae]MDT2806932.1 hypothetical protein [Vagococcus lutrae]MDT2808725.1 hypothetical protein [Vagococcus lutrae]